MTDGQDAGCADGQGRDASGSTPRLQVVEGPLGAREPAPTVRLHREFKGLTVADLLHGHTAERLPGQVRTALHHVQRGAFDLAEQALPGTFDNVLPGPGHRARRRRVRRVVVAVLLLVAAAVVAVVVR